MTVTNLKYSKMDPYLVLEYGNVLYRTKVAENAGKFPVWNEVMALTPNPYRHSYLMWFH